ncbi:hypothetical protein [Metabacillus iocasae]|uniref:Uncharacterized protein n=1 Tax=Priestia iocasae TaxID=2291674 RepID=A0ABS2QWM7_9BACI|nr:hypothetical protein [Metabacillus iocasae]MBM7703688.1 hypothetical protein [Metabacillus iocasae]
MKETHEKNKDFINTVNVHNHVNFAINSMGGIQLVIVILGLFFIHKKWPTTVLHTKKSEKT